MGNDTQVRVQLNRVVGQVAVVVGQAQAQANRQSRYPSWVRIDRPFLDNEGRLKRLLRELVWRQVEEDLDGQG